MTRLILGAITLCGSALLTLWVLSVMAVPVCQSHPHIPQPKITPAIFYGAVRI